MDKVFNGHLGVHTHASTSTNKHPTITPVKFYGLNKANIQPIYKTVHMSSLSKTRI